LITDTLAARFRTVTLEPDPACPLCGSHPKIRPLQA